MKSEERHQLAQNDLRVGLNRWLDRIEPYSNHILGGIVVATVVAVGLILWTRSSAATSEAGWSQMATARTPDDFLRIAEENSGSASSNWAKLQAARLSYSNGIETALTDRKSSDESLKQAKDLYSDLVKQKTTAELREEALKGLGLTVEATSGSDLGDAVKAYEQLIKEYPDSSFRDYAAHRVEELKNPEAGEFYAWFRKQNPKPAARPLPNDGKSAVEGTLKTPDLSELNLNLDTKPKAEAGSPALPAVPATDGKSPPTTPAAPATTPPAESSTPTAPMPTPEAPKPTTPMPMPEASAKTAPMPMPEPPAKPADLPSIPKSTVEPPTKP